MTEDALEEFTVGLSDAEKTDLEEMITKFRKGPSDSLEPVNVKDEYNELLKKSQDLSDYAEILLKIDKKLKVLYGLIRLSDQKATIMNQRINAILELLKEQNILIEK